MERSAVADAPGSLHGFPASLTSFVGRAGAVRGVAGLLEEYRLVTITGPGGAGKTRLADQVARVVVACRLFLMSSVSPTSGKSILRFGTTSVPPAHGAHRTTRRPRF